MDIKEYSKCFAQERIDEDWVWIIQNRVGLWAEQKGNSAIWDCVNTYSQYIGVLKKGLIRKKFAELIVAIRPKGLKDGKTKEQLKGSMDQCSSSLKIDSIDSYSEDDERGKIVKDLKELFEASIPSNREEPNPYTIESRVRQYLEKNVATDQYTTICMGGTYCGYTTTLSLERYASERFMKEKTPSIIYVVECVHEKVSADTLTMMVGRYDTDRKIKLLIASTFGFDEHIKKLATTRNVCLIRVNPKYEISDNDILTPRLEYGTSVFKYEHKMLCGEVPMTVPLVIQDGDYTTTSLRDYLLKNSIPVLNKGIAHAPLLTREFIEEIVIKIVDEDIEKYVSQLKKCDLNDKVPYCCINPYKYAERDNLKVVRSDLSNQKHLGDINLKKRLVRLSDKFETGDPSDRFSMAHEYGHDILHSHLRFREFFERDAELAGEAASDIWEKHWLDVQANYFASCMLMPRKIVKLYYSLYWRKWFKRDEVKPMCIKEPMFWNKDFQNVVAPIARHMNVSLDAMRIRLIDMGLLIDKRENSV